MNISLIPVVKSSQNIGGLALTHLATLPRSEEREEHHALARPPRPQQISLVLTMALVELSRSFAANRALHRSPNRGASGVLCASLGSTTTNTHHKEAWP
jgi:hypothetical protein